MNYIQHEWEQFIADTKMADAPAHQLREMRRSFFGGCLALTRILEKQMSDSDSISQKDLDVAESVFGELEAFVDADADDDACCVAEIVVIDLHANGGIGARVTGVCGEYADDPAHTDKKLDGYHPFKASTE